MTFNQHLAKVKEWVKYCTDWLCFKYMWRHNNDVIFIKISLDVSGQITYKTYISDFHILKINKINRIIPF